MYEWFGMEIEHIYNALFYTRNTNIQINLQPTILFILIQVVQL